MVTGLLVYVLSCPIMLAIVGCMGYPYYRSYCPSMCSCGKKEKEIPCDKKTKEDPAEQCTETTNSCSTPCCENENIVNESQPNLCSSTASLAQISNECTSTVCENECSECNDCPNRTTLFAQEATSQDSNVKCCAKPTECTDCKCPRANPFNSETDDIFVLGKTEEFAVEYINGKGGIVRVVERDDEAFVVTCDEIPERLNLHTTHGLVTKVTFG